MNILKRVLNSKLFCLSVTIIYSQIIVISAILINLIGDDIYFHIGNIWIWRVIITLFILFLIFLLFRRLISKESDEYSRTKSKFSNKEITSLIILYDNVAIVCLGLLMFMISGQLIDIFVTDIITIISSVLTINYHFNKYPT
jgi:hypothetical protein